MADRFFIAPYDANSGLQTNVRPWLIPDEAFSTLQNAYVFRGRVRKRFGSLWLGATQLLSRLRINIGTTDGAGNFAGSVPLFGGTPIATPAVGQMFSIASNVFTVNVLGNPAMLLRSDLSGAAATFDTTTGAVVINGATINTTVYYYSALPVMGLLTFDRTNINNERTIAFDTRFAYEYNNGWERLATEITPGAARWTGSDSQFFWATTFGGANAFDKVFYVTNFNPNEPNFMRTLFNNQWDNFRPAITAAAFLNSARMIVVFKNRLVALNTWEGVGIPGDNYSNRARWSAVGSPLAANAWRQDIPGNGNALDCPTSEAIISSEFIKDRLIVYFERSTWELVYTGNQIYPFAWQQLNTELGAESTFSTVPFDKVVLGVGNVGIHACNGSNVERIDDKIPDTVFEIHNDNAGVERVYGIRDYFVEMVYWTFPSTTSSADFPYPNRVLVFNYKNGTWALNDDSITCFGYYQPQTNVTWSSTTVTWNDPLTWGTGQNAAQYRKVIAGNQEGYTFTIEPDVTTNAPALQITDITVAAGNTVTVTAVNHNLRGDEYIYFQNIVASAGNLTLINNKIFQVVISTQNTFQFTYFDDQFNVIAGTYAGGGIMSRVSVIDIRTKQYNFYAKQGRNAYVSRVDFMVNNTLIEYNDPLDPLVLLTTGGEMTVNYFVSTTTVPLLQDSQFDGTLLGDGTLQTFAYDTVPFERTADRLWHLLYFQADGEVIQLQLTMNDEQIRRVVQIINPDASITYTGPSFVDFQLGAMCIHAVATSYRLQ